MKRLLATLTLCFSATLGLGQAYTPAIRNPGDLSILGEWIFFSPNSESRTFGAFQNGPLGGPGQRFANRFDDFYSGYRVGAAYAFCECNRFFSFLWTSLSADNERTVTSPGITNTLFPGNLPPSLLALSPVGRAFQYHKFAYHSAQATFGQKVICNPCLNLDIFEGLHYAWLSSRDRFFYSNASTGSSVAVKGFNNFWGFGPEVGLHAAVPVWNKLSFTSTCSAALLAGKPDTNYIATAIALGVPVAGAQALTSERAWRVVPFANVSVGLSYDFCLPRLWECVQRLFRRGFKGSVELGYEGLAYFNGLTEIRSVDDLDSGNVLDVYRNVTMHGPYLRATISF